MPLEGPFSWPDKLVVALLLIIGADSLMQSQLCQAQRTSSLFSGIGTSELAWQAIGFALLAAGLPFHLQPAFACEISGVCREVLRDLPIPHIFGDIMMLLACEAVSPDWGFGRKVHAMMAASAFSNGWCYRCQKYCSFHASDIDTSGSPCQDWSSAGLGLGVEGKRIHICLAWARFHLLWETAIVIHENVTNFDIQLLHHFMGHMYHIFAVVCGPDDVGFPFCRRRRLYVALVHKVKMRVLHNPEHVFWRVCEHLRCQARVEDLLLADGQEVQTEVRLLCGDRRIAVPTVAPAMARAVAAESVAPAMARVVAAESVAPAMARAVEPSIALTSLERVRRDCYDVLWRERFRSDPRWHCGLVYNLGDNPDGGWITWSAPTLLGDFCVPTLRRGWTVLWLPALNRWMTVQERLVLMGIPAYPALARLYRFPTTFSLPWHIAKQTIGNGMHLANVGVWQAVVAASVARK